jgi:hypothetical protein
LDPPALRGEEPRGGDGGLDQGDAAGEEEHQGQADGHHASARLDQPLGPAADELLAEAGPGMASVGVGAVPRGPGLERGREQPEQNDQAGQDAHGGIHAEILDGENPACPEGQQTQGGGDGGEHAGSPAGGHGPQRRTAGAGGGDLVAVVVGQVYGGGEGKDVDKCGDDDQHKVHVAAGEVDGGGGQRGTVAGDDEDHQRQFEIPQAEPGDGQRDGPGEDYPLGDRPLAFNIDGGVDHRVAAQTQLVGIDAAVFGGDPSEGCQSGGALGVARLGEGHHGSGGVVIGTDQRPLHT